MASSYTIYKITDTFVLIGDENSGSSVTNDAANVVAKLHRDVERGLGNRKIYYEDSTGRIDMLKHDKGRFTGFAPCSDQQNEFLRQFFE